MKRFTKGLPHPMSLADSQFMQNLLEGVRRKREAATASRPGIKTTHQASKP